MCTQLRILCFRSPAVSATTALTSSFATAMCSCVVTGHTVRVTDLYNCSNISSADPGSHTTDAHHATSSVGGVASGDGSRRSHPFDPTLSAAELAGYLTAYRAGTLPKNVAPHVQDILWADALVLVYPTYWYSLPAILKVMAVRDCSLRPFSLTCSPLSENQLVTNDESDTCIDSDTMSCLCAWRLERCKGDASHLHDTQASCWAEALSTLHSLRMCCSIETCMLHSLACTPMLATR